MATFYLQLVKIWREIGIRQRALFLAISIGMVLATTLVITSLKENKKVSPTTPREVSAKEEKKEGFELFDTNTWIKGEKELQILEMRALKGQLESDLSCFENIQSATVILDLVNPKLFGTAPKPKASVILTLKQGLLSPSLLQALLNHLSGAVRGLQPNMIAVSDTKGRLYHAINEGETLSFYPSLQEEELKFKIDSVVERILGNLAFQTTLTHSLEEKKVGISLLIDKAFFSKKGEIEKQIKSLVSPLYKEISISVVEANFGVKQEVVKPKKRVFLYLLPLALLPLIFLKKARKKNEKPGREINVNALALAIKEGHPKTIATMLSYLEPKAAERILGALPPDVAQKVIEYLG